MVIESPNSCSVSPAAGDEAMAVERGFYRWDGAELAWLKPQTGDPADDVEELREPTFSDIDGDGDLEILEPRRHLRGFGRIRDGRRSGSGTTPCP